jgi:hypothetical protein
VLGNRARADALRRRRGLLARELNGIAGEKDADVVTLVERRASDQQAEGNPSRILGPGCDVDQ